MWQECDIGPLRAQTEPRYTALGAAVRPIRAGEADSEPQSSSALRLRGLSLRLLLHQGERDAKRLE